jgi:3-isopropylmalate/(R)-2-methylmalate dehydratase small subunit
MNPVTTISGTAAPLPRANIDTDQIIPKQFLKRVERSGFGEFLFFDWKADNEGELDPDFVLNKPQYSDAQILVTGPNFGSGSSREHAPWALEDWGFRAVIASSFADIFKGNCSKIGLLTIELTDDEVSELMAIIDSTPNTVTVDLEHQTVTADGFAASFDIDEFTKYCLMTGQDHIALSLRHTEHIDSHEATRPPHRPTVPLES